MNDFDASILRGYDQAIAHARDMTHDMTLEEDARRYWLAEHRALSEWRGKLARILAEPTAAQEG